MPPIQPPEPEDLEDLPDEDETEEEEEEDETEEVAAAPPVQAQPEPVAPKRRGRPKGSKNAEPRPVGVGAAQSTPKTYWQNRNLEILWPDVLKWLREQHRTPFEVDIRVKRTEPVESMIGVPFNGGTVSGEGAPAATQIVEKITNEYHLPSGTVSPARYKIEIFWRVNSHVLTWGELRLASPDAILAMRRQQQMAAQQQPVGYGAPTWQGPHYPPPPSYPQYQQQPYPPPQYPPPYAGYGAPPQAPPQGGTSEADQRELGYLRGTMDEVLRALREGRQPNIQPPPQAPPQAPGADMEERIVQRIMGLLRPGLGAVPAAGAAVTANASPLANTLEASVQQIITSGLQGLLKKVGQNMDQAFRGETGQAAEAVAEVIHENPADHLPYEAIPVGSKWADGREVVFPRDKETGSINWMGALFSNPFIMEKMSDSANGLAGAVTDVVKNVGRQAMQPGSTVQAQVVSHIPRAAVHAGVSQAPQAPAPHPAVQTAPQPPPPPPHQNGAAASSNGGWPTG
jgi:hypothetical protein